MTETNRNSESSLRRSVFTNKATLNSLTIFLYLTILSCGQGRERDKNPSGENITYRNVKPASIKHAKGFMIEYYKDHKLLKLVNRSSSQADTLRYALVQQGTQAPNGFDKSEIITIPVRNVIGMSSLQIAMAEFCESADIIGGLASTKYVSSTAVQRSINAGKIKEVGDEGSLNIELIIAMKPDLILGTGTPGTSVNRYQALQNAGIPVLPIAEWLEETPLGRAEWVKLIAALVNKEELATKKFDRIEKQYISLAEIGRKAKSHPEIIVGMPYKGAWFVPDGKSFLSRFFKDAGASYAWMDVKGTGSMGLSFEAVSPYALKAAFWINTGTANSKADIAALDTRYTFFKPYKQNRIYNFNKRVNEKGSNDYWESGAVNPHIVLSDLIKIFHPELLPNHELVYYKQIL